MDYTLTKQARITPSFLKLLLLGIVITAMGKAAKTKDKEFFFVCFLKSRSSDSVCWSKHIFIPSKYFLKRFLFSLVWGKFFILWVPRGTTTRLPAVTAVLPIALYSSYLESACFGFHAQKVEGASVSPSYAPERAASLFTAVITLLIACSMSLPNYFFPTCSLLRL